MGETLAVALGGLGEIGLNTLVLEAGEDMILVDCGLMFPQARHPGIDYVIPDFSYVREKAAKLRGVVLTHGHDDHVGAIPHLLREWPVPVWGTPMALGLLEGRLTDLPPTVRGQLHAVAPGRSVEVGPFRAEFLHVTHSVPDSCAVGVETPGGRVLHTGDFKFDPQPVDGRVTDEASLARWGDAGVDLLCCDSTNAHCAGSTPSERSVGPFFRQVCETASGRVYVTTFASNVHRLQQVVEASRMAGRRIALLGRSVRETSRLARRLGHLRVAPGDLVPEPRSRGLPRTGLTVVLGGSQGEAGSALWRVVLGKEPHHRVRAGDHVVFSSRIIPGNETAVYHLANECVRQGATVHLPDVESVHVSGHPAAEDVRRMVRLTRPRHVLPIHGEPRHLEALVALVREEGLESEEVYRMENGQSLLLRGRRLERGPRVPTGRVYLDRGDRGVPGDGVLEVRQRMAREGVAVIALAVRRGKVVAGPTVRVSGVFPPRRVDEVCREAETELIRHCRDSRLWEPGARPADELTRILRRHFRRLGGRRPFIHVEILEPDEAL